MAYAQRATVLKGDYSPGQMLTMIGHFAFAVGMRLHFLMFAALQRVPFVALPYASKVTGFLDALEMPMPPLQLVKAGQLIAHIDRWWDRRSELQARIDKVLPSLQERASETNRLAVRLLLERTADRETILSKIAT
jgi:polysaccharide pyruvyl transferase WcaK-like protein